TFLGASMLLPGMASAELEAAAAQARVEAELGQSFASASVDQVAEAVAGIVAALPPEKLQRAIDLVGGVAPLMPDRTAAERVAEAARAAAEEVAAAHPEVIEDWWARIISDSIAMAAVEGRKAAKPAPAASTSAGFSFAEAQSKVAARLGEPIADAEPDKLGQAVGAEIAALPPDRLQHSITIAGAVAAELTNPTAMRSVADSAAAAVERVAAGHPDAVPDWRKDGIVESIALFVGLDYRGGGRASAPLQERPTPNYSVADGDLAIVAEPTRMPEAAAVALPPGVGAEPDTGPVEETARPPAAAQAVALHPPVPAVRPGRDLPQPDEVRALLREHGLSVNAQNLNRAMAALLSGRRDIEPALAGASCDGLGLSGLRAAAADGRCTAEYGAALSVLQPAAGAAAPRGRAADWSSGSWWHDAGSDSNSRASADNDPSSPADRDPLGNGGAGGDAGDGNGDGGRGGNDGGNSGGGAGADRGNDDGRGNDGGRGGSGRGDRDDDDRNDDDGDDGGRGRGSDRGDRGDRGDRDDDRDRGGGRGRDQDRGLGSVADRVNDAVGGLLD
ncbi:MAG TPA: hypothetical protein VFO41_13620, partial [Alphaproteobacteria bacterium]|nr:hypothetical protein [Alphaproteobacteria bacterium]